VSKVPVCDTPLVEKCLFTQNYLEKPLGHTYTILHIMGVNVCEVLTDLHH